MQSEARKASQHAYYLAHKDEYKARALTRNQTPEGRETARRCMITLKYGISYTEYERMEREQHGACAICKAIPNPHATATNNRRLHVDHNHDTGKVRALLCARCNRAIGQFNDNSKLLRRAANYIDGEQSVY